MGRKVIIILIFMMVVFSARGEESFMTVGIINPLSSNLMRPDTTMVNISLIGNRLGSVKALNICGISALTEGDAQGMQLSLVYSHIRGNMKGVNFSTFNVVNREGRGWQSGVFNFLGRSYRGVQGAAFVNFVGGGFIGYQQSSLFNTVGGDFVGVQSGGAGNICGGNFRGVQLGTTFNFTAHELKGLQLSNVNVSGRNGGMQMGLINIAQQNDGCQMGLLNIAEEQNGVVAGLINLSDDGNISWQNYLSNYAGFITAVRFESGNFVSSIELGGPELVREIDESFMVGFHYGYGVPWGQLSFIGDAGYYHVLYPEEGDKYLSDISSGYGVQLRLSLDYRLRDWLSMFVGGGISSYGEYENNEVDGDELLYFVGLNIF